MSRSDAERIDDILDACEELADIVNQGRAAFDSRSVLRRAAERLLDVIGEAAVCCARPGALRQGRAPV